MPNRSTFGQQFDRQKETDKQAEPPANVRQRARQQVEQIEMHFERQIAHGLVKPGDQLPAERDIGVQFRASRKTVRAALTRLADKGLVVRRLGSGTFVSSGAEALELELAPTFPTPIASPLDILEIRRALEPGCMELVVARATEDDFDRMEARLREMWAARDQVEFKKAGYAFQREVARASRNPIFISVQEMIVAARARAGWSSLLMLEETPELRERAWHQHAVIYEALRARDSERATRLSALMLSEMIRMFLEAPIGA